MDPLAGIKRIADLPIENQRLFVRVDFNVPMDKGVITDDSRIREALPTLRHALERGAKVVIASHLGRPKAPKPEAKQDGASSTSPGRGKNYTPGLSLEPCGARLACGCCPCECPCEPELYPVMRPPVRCSESGCHA